MEPGLACGALIVVIAVLIIGFLIAQEWRCPHCGRYFAIRRWETAKLDEFGDEYIDEARMECGRCGLAWHVSVTRLSLGGHDLGDWVEVDNGWQATCRRCGLTTWIGFQGLLYSLLEDECTDRSAAK